MEQPIDYTETQINDLIKGIYAGEITMQKLPVDLYLAIAKVLNKGVAKGMVDAKFGKASKALRTELTENIYIFSGGKTFQQVREMQKYLLDADGYILPYNEFKKVADVIFDKYNKTWLETEYITAIGQAATAVKWEDIQKYKNIFPYLRYNAVMDTHTSEICKALNRTTLKVDDSFWDTHSPLQHFRCRCVLEQLEEAE